MSKKSKMHIAVAGNIGVGKTTLTEMLAKHYHWTPQFEAIKDNPYLVDFYNDMLRWSFNIQMYFLQSRIRQLIEVKQSPKTVIQDRTIYEDAYIFAPNLHEMGLMKTRDFENYFSFFKTINQIIEPPDLLIYLKASLGTLVNQIQKRGRDYEEDIRLDYLKRLNQHYEHWINKYQAGRLLIINCDELKFQDKSEDFSTIINRIEAELNGLF